MYSHINMCYLTLRCVYVRLKLPIEIHPTVLIIRFK